MRRISFRDRENLEIPSSSEITKLSKDQLHETAVGISYALQHGSGSTVRLAFPFAYTVAALCKQNKDQDPQTLVQQLEEEGRNANYGTAMVEWD